MKTPSVLLLLSLLLITSSCFNFKNESETDFTNDENMYTPENFSEESPKEELAKNDNLVYKNIMDTKLNMVSSRILLPKSWNLAAPNQQGLFIEAPNDIQVHYLKNNSFMFSQDPYTQQIYAQSGVQMRPMPTPEQIFEQDLFPLVAQNGFKIKKQYHLQKLAALDQQYMNQLYQSAPSQKSYDVLAIELEGTKENSSLVILKTFNTLSQGMSVWGYHGYVLESPTSTFQNSKDTFLNALHTVQYNPQQIAAFNRNEQQKEGASWARHNQKMAVNQQNFEASQRAYRQNSEAINNSIMQTWRTQNESSDRMQEKFVDGIWEQSNMTDPYSGQNYKVDQGYNNYWTNGNGEYIPTDDYFYNPNTDPNVNNQNWEQMTPTSDDGW